MTALNKALFARQLSRLLPEPTQQLTLFLAYSGGVDSSVLLNLSAQYAADKELNLKVLHVNHGVSSQAGQWQQFCEQQCDFLQVECLVKQLDLSGVSANFEQTARGQRYQFFAQHVELGDVLLTAHHQDDQIETVLMRLFRGSGVRGLSGIAPTRSLKGMQVIRPLLEFNKQSLVDFAQLNHIRWVEDDSNNAQHFDRNLIRHSVLPTIKAAIPESQLGVAVVSQKANSAQILLNELGEIDITACEGQQRSSWFDLAAPLSWEKLSRLSDERIINAIDTWTQPHVTYSAPRAKLTEWLEQIKAATNETHPLLVHEGRRLQYAYGFLHFLRALPDGPASPITWDISESLVLSELGLELTAELGSERQANAALFQLEDDKVEVVWRKGGERIRQKGREHSQSLKKCLQENTVPHWDREYLPMIKVGDKLVWSGALGQLACSIKSSKGKIITFAMSNCNSQT